jgi:hypothetical protein
MLKLLPPSDDHRAAEYNPNYKRSFIDDNGDEICSVAVAMKLLQENRDLISEMESTMAALEV